MELLQIIIEKILLTHSGIFKATITTVNSGGKY